MISLMLEIISLFRKKYSLLWELGNLTMAAAKPLLAMQIAFKRRIITIFPVIFPDSREFRCRDRFASDWVRHQQIQILTPILG